MFARWERAGPGEKKKEKKQNKKMEIYIRLEIKTKMSGDFFSFEKKKNTQSLHELQEWIELAYSLDWSELRNASRQFFFQRHLWNCCLVFFFFFLECDNIVSGVKKRKRFIFFFPFLRVERVKKGRLTRNGPATNVK